MELLQARWLLKGLSAEGFAVKPPQLTFNDRLTVNLGDVTLRLLFFGRAHSTTDLVILIPEEKTLLLGCFFLVQDSVPRFGVQPVLDVDRWLEVLHTVTDGEQLQHVIPGQHALWSPAKLVLWRDYIDELWQAVRAEEAKGVSLEQAKQGLKVPPSLDHLRDLGVADATITNFHRSNVTAFWRQLKESASQIVAQTIAEAGLEAGLAKYGELRAQTDNAVFFDEGEFNALGYRLLLGEGKVAEAIAVFKLNVAAYPDSWNVYDSLGEAYMVNGDRELAIEHYRKSVRINPDNDNGKQMLERLAEQDQ